MGLGGIQEKFALPYSPMRCILYARKSTDDKARQVQSIPDQIRVLSDLAAQRALEIDDIIQDSKSAKEPGRVGFNDMIGRIKRGEADSILCWSMDRLTRNPKDGGEIMWLLQQGVLRSIITPERTYLPEDSSILLSVETGRSTDYVRKLSTDVRRGMQSKVKQGWMPSRAPIGYRNEKEADKGKKRILPDPASFEAVQNLWKHLYYHRCSLAELHRYMSEQCQVFVKGQLLPFSTFCRIFRCPFYYGVFSIKGVLHPGSHQPMVTQEEFTEVQTILAGTFVSRARKYESPFKGLMHCSGCTAWITPEKKRKFVKSRGTTEEYGYLRCVHRKKSEKPCREKPMSEKAVLQFIKQEIGSVSLPPEVIELGLRKLAEEKQQTEPTLTERSLSHELYDLRRTIQTMRRNLARTPNPDIQEIIAAEIKASQVREQGLQQELQRALRERMTKNEQIRDNLQLIRNAWAILKNGTIKERRQLVLSLGSNWRILDKSLHYEPNLIPIAIRKAKEQFHLQNATFEPLRSQCVTGETCSAERAEIIWSGIRESNPRLKLGKLAYYHCTNPACAEEYCKE